MPEVSVIIPNYNHAAYLKQRIDSVLEQTYQDFEIIILDDCSTDNSARVLQSYKDHPKVSHIVFNETNSGSPFVQWDKGINLARGKYIWMAESDDWCEPILLQTLMEGLLGNVNCVLAYAQSYLIMGSEVIRLNSSHRVLAEYLPGNEYVPAYLGNVCRIINASMAVFRKDCYLNVAPDFKTFKLCGDWLFWIQIALQGDVFISGKVLNYFRKHDEDVTGKMNTTGNNYLEEIRVLKILKGKQLINDEQYKTYLLDRYIKYDFYKKTYAKDIRWIAEQAFFDNDGHSIKSFLKRNSFIALLKARISRRLGLR